MIAGQNRLIAMKLLMLRATIATGKDLIMFGLQKSPETTFREAQG